MCVLVVGGAGYIGSHVCKVLKESGWVPVVFDNLSTGHKWGAQFGSLVIADVEDEGALFEAFASYQPEAVIYLASLINVRDSILDPELYYRHNMLGAITLLSAMRKAGVSRLIFSSTAAVYGTPMYLPIDEKHPKSPLNAYGKSKWAIEAMLEDFAHAYGLSFVAFRYFNACGADPSGMIGEEHEPETHLIPLAIQTALGERPFLPIYGNDYSTPDGTAIRDYVHVLDLALAHLQALDYLRQERSSVQLNLGSGCGYSVRQIVDAVSAVAGKPIPTQILPRLPQDSPVLVADVSYAQSVLNWTPGYTLPEIVATAYRWHAERALVKL